VKLDTNLQRTPIESIINSVIQNKIVKQKMHGEMMVQVSNVGFETFGKKDSLKFYGYEQDGKVRKIKNKYFLTITKYYDKEFMKNRHQEEQVTEVELKIQKD